MIEQTTIKKSNKTAICNSGTIAFIIDFRTTCKPVKIVVYKLSFFLSASFTIY